MDWLKSRLGNNIVTDRLHRMLYATDASVYRAIPAGVAFPEDVEQLHTILTYAQETGTPLIPRTAGTSLAGQVVGNGLVIDFSRYMNRIIDFDPAGHTVTVEPGVIRDVLNAYLKPHGLHFGPDTSTSNRCMIGGMVGNNSCGTTSITYGSTRDRLLKIEALLSDGSEVAFHSMDSDAFQLAKTRQGLEGILYSKMAEMLLREGIRDLIAQRFPRPEIHRRNTGYALDILSSMQPFNPDGKTFNFCSLLAGSEGTLALSHRITLQLDSLPPPFIRMVCAHFHSLRDMTSAVGRVMQHSLFACELMDKTVLDCTKENRAQRENRFFLEGDPAALLIMECRSESETGVLAITESLIQTLRSETAAYAMPVIKPPDTEKVWALRKAGLGVLGNLPGDAKAVACIEDTAVALEDLPAYIEELDGLIRGYGQRAAYFAHAGAGEIHVRPILNLKVQRDQQLFETITTAVADLVARYKGSLSGEHGDGRVRGAVIPRFFGPEITALFREIKDTWDPQGIFNPGKIIGAAPMLNDLRYHAGHYHREYKTMQDFSESGGILRMAERCNGAGDCRKLPGAGGTMCPSYHVTRDEKDTTRGRANAFREVLSHSTYPNPFLDPALTEVMALCISCKGCTSECPSGVDMSAMKAEWLHQTHKAKGIPFKTRMLTNMPWILNLTVRLPGARQLLNNSQMGSLVKRILGIHPDRSLPRLNNKHFATWAKQYLSAQPTLQSGRGKVYLFIDEFTAFYDDRPGRSVIKLLYGLGYHVEVLPMMDSGRTAISMGRLDKAADLALHNLSYLAEKTDPEIPVIGIEPSALLGFRDEYVRLVRPDMKDIALTQSRRIFLFEEWMHTEISSGRISAKDFDNTQRVVVYHGHCHQKALSDQGKAAAILALPTGHSVLALDAGCCGMAGFFGYELEHYPLSLQMGEQRLFPALRNLPSDTFLVASGHSCRHQIYDAIGRSAIHPSEILLASLDAART